MNFSQFFSPRQQQQQPQNPQGTQQNQQQQQQPANANTPSGQNNSGNTNPSGIQPNQNNNVDTDPLDIFKGLFDNTKQNQPETPPSFTLAPDKLKEISGSLDFRQNINPELMQRAQSGDFNAQMEIMNGMMQQLYQTQMTHTSALSGEYINQRFGFEDKRLDSKVNGVMTSNAVKGLDVKHPLIRQQLDDIAKRIRQQNPEATPDEVAKGAMTYLQELSKAFGGSSNGAGDKNSNGSQAEEAIDWDKFAQG